MQIDYVVPEGYELAYGTMSQQTYDEWPACNKPSLDKGDFFYLGEDVKKPRFPVKVIRNSSIPLNKIYLTQRDKDEIAPECGYATIRER